MGSIADWVTETHKRVGAYSLVFLQAGRANDVVVSDLCSSCDVVATVDDFLARDDEESGLIVLTDLESLVARERAHKLFGPLRARIISEMAAGNRFILLSRAPRIAFPEVVGSSVLEDASFWRVTPGCDDGPMGRFRSWSNSTSEEEFFEDVVAELGSGVLASLDENFFELMLSGNEMLNLLAPREIEALEGAGLLLREHAELRWAAPQRLGELKNAIGNVVSSAVESPPEAGDVYRSLWVMERIIRNALRAFAREKHQHRWRSVFLSSDLARAILERASLSGYSAAVSINEVRDPLEWLTLGELLSLRDQSKEDFGMPSRLWILFNSEIAPIRNRLSHMRSLKPHDSRMALKWEKVLLRKVGWH